VNEHSFGLLRLMIFQSLDVIWQRVQFS
jgi:hypothetical protein